MTKPVERSLNDGGSKPRRRRVLLVDDHPLMRSGLRLLLDAQPDLVVAGEAGSVADALRFTANNICDLVVTDLALPGRGGLELIKDLRALYPNLPILVLSMHDEALYAERVLRSGARGYLAKEAGGERLLEAVRQVLNGEVYLSTTMTTSFLAGLGGQKGEGSCSPFERLTDREMEVFQLVGQGKSAREIARLLNLSPKTVDVHRARIKSKLELGDIPSLIRYAVRWSEGQ